MELKFLFLIVLAFVPQISPATLTEQTDIIWLKEKSVGIKEFGSEAECVDYAKQVIKKIQEEYRSQRVVSTASCLPIQRSH